MFVSTILGHNHPFPSSNLLKKTEKSRHCTTLCDTILHDFVWKPATARGHLKQARQEASITWCDLFRPKFGQKMPKMITSHDVFEPLKQALSASCDVNISGQVCGLKLQKVFTLGDGCWLPTSVIISTNWRPQPLSIKTVHMAQKRGLVCHIFGSLCHVFCRDPLTSIGLLSDFYPIRTPIVWQNRSRDGGGQNCFHHLCV